MKVLTKNNEQLAGIALVGGKDAPLKATITVGDKVIESPEVQTAMTCVDGNLETAIRIPGLVNMKLVLEPEDVKALKGLMSKDVIKFMMKSFF